MEIQEEFRYRLEKALTSLGMKPVDLAKKTGLSESTISQYRSGYAKPKEKKLGLIADALGVNPAWLMGLDVPMKENKNIISKEDFMKLAFPGADGETKKKLDEYYDFFIRLASAPEETQKAVETILKSVLPKP